ncbi:hypothetical protein ACOMHN_026637 [Nucella lapillus]
MTIRSKTGETTNVASVGMNLSESSQAKPCHTTDGNICFEWQGDRTLHISRDQSRVINSDVDCYDVTWTALNCVTQVLQDCYSLGEAYWYGGIEDYNQFWPLISIHQNMASYVTGDAWNKQYGDVLESLFVSSNGFGIYIYPEVPLHLSFNQSGNGLLCLAAKYNRYPYFNYDISSPVLRYQVCQGSDVRDLHSHMTSLHVPKPRDIPAEYLFRGAIWSTWAMYKGPVNQSLVLEFARKIVSSGLPYSQLEIDDDWTPKYGDLDFNRDKFPDAKGMITQLSDMGFRVLVWIHPFMNLDSDAADYAIRNGYVVKVILFYNNAFFSSCQVNTFLPFLQFSVGPWVYNSTIQSICKKFTDLRSRYTDTFISLAREATKTGTPIVRPLW